MKVQITGKFLEKEANPIPLMDPAQYVDQLCLYGFGKFTHNKYPWVYWEPTDQVRRKHRRNSYGRVQCGDYLMPILTVELSTILGF